MTNMAGKKRKQNSFIVQAGILAAAGIISRIIGLLYRAPLTGIIGDEGNGYYTSAYNIYAIILLISSYSIPAAVSKVIAQKLALKEYKNAHRIFICSIWYVVLVGGVASLIAFFGSGLLVKGASAIVLKIFAPTIFFSGLLGVLRGYFQAHKTMLQTSVSQILEQILNAVISILAAYLFITISLGSLNTYQVNQGTGTVGFESHETQSEANTKNNGEINDVLGIYSDSNQGTDGEETDSVSQGDLGESPTISVKTLTKEQIEWNSKHALYGAAGSALGTGVGVLIALLFMYSIYLLNRKTILRRVKNDRSRKIDSYSDVFKLVLSVVTPFILSTAVYNLSTSLNQTIYLQVLTSLFQKTEAEAYTLYGIYGGKAVVISNIPIALASAMSAAVLPSIAAHYARKEMTEARAKIAGAIRTTMLIAIPAAAGLAVLSKPITQVLFWQKDSLDMAAGLLSVLAISVIFYTLSTITNAVLQGIGRVNKPVVNAAAGLIIQTIILIPLLIFTDLGLYALAISNIIYSGSMCLLNGLAVRKHLIYHQEMVKTYLLPIISAIIMGGIAWGVYHGLYLLCKINVLCLAIAISIAAPIYFVLLIKLRAVNEEELRNMPKGGILIKAAKKLRLL